MSNHKSIAKLEQAKEKLLGFSNANGFSNVAGDSQIEILNQAISDEEDKLRSHNSGLNNLEYGFKNRCKLAWEDSSSGYRKGSFDNYLSNCVYPLTEPCINKFQFGRAGRYRDRYADCNSKYFAYLDKKDEGELIELKIENLREQKRVYSTEVNDAIGRGLSLEQAQALAQAKISQLLVTQEANRLLTIARQEKDRRKAQYNPLSTYLILGGFVLAGVTIFMLFRKKKK